MSTKTYSFADVKLVLSHRSIGRYTFTGVGLGSVTVTQSTDRTSHDVAADGSVMVSKVEGNNGMIAIQIQQTSEGNQWLLNAWNFLITAPASDWAKMAATIRGISGGDMVNATGMAFQNRAELSYQAQGQQRTWNLMAANINEQNVAQ